MKKDIFISTTLPYANSTPHIGHTLEFVQADALNRFFKTKTYTFFNIGLDEHGQKVYDSALKDKTSIEDYLDNLSDDWLYFCEIFNIEYDKFYRTSSTEHKTKVKEYWNKLLEKGDIYLKSYTSKYCKGCESFKTDKDLHFNICLDHPTLKIETVSEENYFFKLSNYKEDIKNYLTHNKGFLNPKNKDLELFDLIENSTDISISRLKKSVKWGITCPSDENQVIYVWFEALLNYLFSIGEDNWSDFLTIQLCGPDNIRFEGLILQAIFKAGDVDFTNYLLVHGTILDIDGSKMSKSSNNVISPFDQFNKYGDSAIRLYLLTQLSQYSNSSYNEEDLISFYNSFLCNEFGNLLTRTLHLIDIKNITIVEPSDELKEETYKEVQKYDYYFSNFNLQASFNIVHKLVKQANQTLNNEKPWSKECLNPDYSINKVYYLVCKITDLLNPFIPSEIYKIEKALHFKKKVNLFKRIE